MKVLDASGQQLGYVLTVTDHEGYGGDIQFAELYETEKEKYIALWNEEG